MPPAPMPSRWLPALPARAPQPVPRVAAAGSVALFSYGFRPFFLGAGVWAIVSVGLWVGVLTAGWPLATLYGPLAWHAHEALFGYGSAVVAGFLMTAVPNWTGRLPVAGRPLAALFALWCLGRLAFLASDVTGPLAAAAVDALFLPALLLVMAREIVAGRNWRNLRVLVLVAVLAAANVAFHAETLLTGAPDVAVRLGTAALIALIMLVGGRIVPSFTRNWLVKAGFTALPAPFGRFDMAALGVSVLALGAWVAAPDAAATGAALLAAGAVQVLRLRRWAGMPTWREPLVLILHVGYGFVPLGFLACGIAVLRPDLLAASAALHAWTTGAVGVMTVAVMTRATRGHTGRALTAPPATVALYAAVVLAALLRIAAGLPGFDPAPMYGLSGLFWIAGFVLFLAGYAPMLARPPAGRG